MDFAVLLRQEFECRRLRNARYSLRAFARDLGTDHATLSQWLRGRRRLSAARMRRVGVRLKLDRATIERCCAARDDDAVLAALRARPERIGSRRLARSLGIGTDEVNIALHRLLVGARLRMPHRNEWIATEDHDA